jgi:hypothetical protein
MRKVKEEAVETSRRLADAVEAADQEERINSARAAVFESAHAPKEKPMAGGAQAIVDDHFEGEVDVARQHRELEEMLRTSDRPGHQANALENAEVNARRAMRLYLRFRQMRFDWEQDNQVLFASMRHEATKALQREKEQGYRAKQITDADVASMCSHLFPDEWRAQESRRNRAHLAEKSLEHLVEVWASKCRSLNVLVGRGR